MIYHYTGLGGLMGIVTTRTLWASDCRFLNDGREVEYAKSLFFDQVDKLKLPDLEDGGYRLPSRGEWHMRLFVTCFCAAPDLLSQWRGYASDQGYALGFSMDAIRPSPSVGTLEPVRYGIPAPGVYFRRELRGIRPVAHPGVKAAVAAELLLPRIANIKHPAFRQEREWRWSHIQSRHHFADEAFPVRFRESVLGPVPFIEWSFDPAALVRIIVGPGSHFEERRAGLEDLLEAKGFGFGRIEIDESEIPLRW